MRLASRHNNLFLISTMFPDPEIPSSPQSLHPIPISRTVQTSSHPHGVATNMRCASGRTVLNKKRKFGLR